MNSSDGHGKTLDSSCPLKPQSVMLLGLLAYIYIEHQRPEKATVILSALDALGMADTRQRMSLALAQLRSGKADAALGTLDRVAMHGGMSAPFHLVRAQALVVLGRPAEAEAAMRAYISLRSTDAAPSSLPGHATRP